MAQAGYTPIQLYYSTTASAAPSSGNLANGELAINITDGKLYYKDNGGTVRVLAGTGGTGVVAGSNTQVQFNNNGVFGASSSLTWNGTTLTTQNLALTGNVTSNLLFTDNTYDIGASGATRPRSLYLGTNSYVAGKQLIGSVTTTKNLRLSESLAVVSTAADASGIAITGYSGTVDGNRPLIDFQRSRGTTDGSMTAVANGDSIGSIIFRGADGASFIDGAGVLGIVDGAVSTGGVPMSLGFYTGTNGSIFNRYTINSNGTHTWFGSIVNPTISSAGFMGLGGNTSPLAWLALGNVNSGTGEATYKGAIQIQSAGGGNALYGAGLEFKSASSGAGYGWSIAAPDLTSGNVPLVITRRNDSALWSEVARFSGTATPGLIVGGTSTVGGARITAQSNQSGTGFITNSAIFAAYNPTPGTEVPGLYLFDGNDSTLLTQVAGTFGISQNGVVRAFFTRSGGKTLFGLGASSASQDIYVTTGATTSMSLDTTATNTYSSYRLNNGNTGGAGNGAALHYFGSTYPTDRWSVASSTGLASWGSGGTHIAQLDSGGAGKINFWTGSSAGNLRLSIPNNASGIEYPTSPVLSSDPRTLDTYEEGSYDAIITSDGTQPTVTYSYRACTYTRVGNVVTVRLALSFNVTVAGSGQLYVSLPFTSANLANFYQHWLSGYYNQGLAENIVAGGVTWSSTVAILYTGVNAQATNAATVGARSFQATFAYFTPSV